MTEEDRENGRKGGFKRWEGSTPQERSEAARKAIRARWARPRAAAALPADPTHEPSAELMPFWVAAGEANPELNPADRLAQAKWLQRRAALNPLEEAE